MRGERYLTKNEEYQIVYERGTTRAARCVIVKAMANGRDLSRYGFTVSRKVGKAVVRNKVRRRMREILKQTSLRPGWDIVIIARAAAAQADYTGLTDSIHGALRQAGVMAGRDEGVGPAAD